MAWLVLVALLPWWLGLPLLIALAGVAVLLQARLRASELRRLRRALHWGLPGFLLALVYSLGADVLAWIMTLVASLAAFTLLAGIDAWLDRELRRDPAPPSDTEWPEIARGPIGPAAQIIELQPLTWGSLSTGLIDPRGELPRYRDGSVHFADGSVIVDVGPDAGFSPDGQWFFSRLQSHAGIVLWDRQRNRQHRLHGWDLCGWDGVRPWIMRGNDGTPQAL
jgi:hypothetical protein